MNEKILCDGTRAGPQKQPHQAFVCLDANETPDSASSALFCPVLDVTVKMLSVGMWRRVKAGPLAGHSGLLGLPLASDSAAKG